MPAKSSMNVKRSVPAEGPGCGTATEGGRDTLVNGATAPMRRPDAHSIVPAAKRDGRGAGSSEWRLGSCKIAAAS